MHIARFWLSILLLVGTTGHAAQAPYLAVVGGKDGVERLPLKLTNVHAEVFGPIADVRISQHFENRGTQAVEAIYVFPASATAAVYAMTMTVGDRRVRAQIDEKDKAEREYRQAVAQGKTASLLESADDHLFKMRVGNILPGDQVSVELNYTELLVPDRGRYELVVPNTVAARYSQAGSLDPSGPSSRDPAVIDYAFNFSARLHTALPLADVSSPSHQIEVSRSAPNAAQVVLAGESLRDAAGRDVQLRYRLQGGAIETGLSLYPEGDGGYFLLQVEPPERVLDADVPPREYIFVVDVSGSMGGAPLDIARDLLRDLLQALDERDYLNVLLFSGGSSLLSERSLPANASTLARATELIHGTPAGGGTELVQAMERAMAIPRAGTARSIVVVTDGGITADAELLRAIRAGLGSANVFALGVGPSVQRDVVERIARAGAGEPFIVDDLAAGADVAQRMRSYIDRPLLTSVEVRGDDFAISGTTPDPVPDLMAERPLVVVGRYRGAPTGSIEITGQTPRGPYRRLIPVADAVHLPEGRGLRYLWARRQLMQAQDDHDAGWDAAIRSEMKSRIVALGIEHSLLTAFTSFVAIDERIRADGQPVPVEQPAVATATAAAGNALATTAALRVHAASAVAAAACSQTRAVAGRAYCLSAGTWTDRELPADAPRLRIRRDSAAMRVLLALRPELRQALALGARVVVRIGRWAIAIGPTGFTDVSQAVWQRVLASDSR
jgi:Ca-activated chloride channel family protein